MCVWEYVRIVLAIVGYSNQSTHGAPIVTHFPIKAHATSALLCTSYM